jgi:hypothetical protein
MSAVDAPIRISIRLGNTLCDNRILIVTGWILGATDEGVGGTQYPACRERSIRAVAPRVGRAHLDRWRWGRRWCRGSVAPDVVSAPLIGLDRWHSGPRSTPVLG